MKDISLNTLATVISLASVIVLFVMGCFNSFGNSWLAVFIGGIIAATVRIMSG